MVDRKYLRAAEDHFKRAAQHLAAALDELRLAKTALGLGGKGVPPDIEIHVQPTMERAREALNDAKDLARHWAGEIQL